ncbi:MAG: 3'-5' exonuclease [Paludibacteraceae bacterium]|jgi:DNA polymerase-3 subunit epsilon|nr:3'-5' exonuclease [Paludibacteraceae bacterium]
MRLRLTRPLVFFDLETTGLNIGRDRIVELSYYKVYPDGTSEGKTYRVKPTVVSLDGKEVQMHIPDEAAAVHGIHDEDVAQCPTFKEIAAQLWEVMEDSDLAGYNSTHFDVPLLAEEFMRAGVNADLKRKNLLDAYTIFQQHEPRNLTAAYKFYCGKNLEDAHSADADTMAAYEVFAAQTERYDDMPETVEELAQKLQGDHRYADFAGRVELDRDGKEVFTFGKYRGQRVEDVFRRDTGYYRWLIDSDFPQYTKNVFTRIFIGLRK